MPIIKIKSAGVLLVIDLGNGSYSETLRGLFHSQL